MYGPFAKTCPRQYASAHLSLLVACALLTLALWIESTCRLSSRAVIGFGLSSLKTTVCLSGVLMFFTLDSVSIFISVFVYCVPSTPRDIV